MTDDRPAAWSREIRDYLLGRLGSPHQTVPLERAYVQPLRPAPIQRWWIFEGRRFPTIGGKIAAGWPELLRSVLLLDRTFNPRTRLSERLEGDVDWGATLARGPLGLQPEYVVRSSGVGLDDAEHDALRGWLTWIAREWQAYAQRFGLSAAVGAAELLADIAAVDRPAPTPDQLRRWAHAARRSRWPVLRNVVAETLRAAIEPIALDQIPLPSDRAKLFELLCLVRIVSRLAGTPDQLRWLDLELGNNVLRLPGVTCRYQQFLGREAVLSTSAYHGGLAEAAGLFGLHVPTTIDLAVEFDEPRQGIAGILVEAKSGGQAFDAAVEQLRAYREARPRPTGSRFLTWGITERAAEGPPTAEQLDWLRQRVGQGSGDVWFFSDADFIDVVLDAGGLSRKAADAPARTDHRVVGDAVRV